MTLFFLPVPEWGVIITRSRLWLRREQAEAVQAAWASTVEVRSPLVASMTGYSYEQLLAELAELRAAMVTMGWVGGK